MTRFSLSKILMELTYNPERGKYALLPPKKFDPNEPLLITGEQTCDTCQNIQPGTKPINISITEYKEEVRKMLPFRAT